MEAKAMAELVRIEAVYLCPACGEEFTWAEGEDFTGVPAQQVACICTEADDEDT